ncbi:MAG: hypothetical protein ACE5WD_02680 [Candidatus Aminicenantia bacterium]
MSSDNRAIQSFILSKNVEPTFPPEYSMIKEKILMKNSEINNKKYNEIE